MKAIERTSRVVSISLPAKTAERHERERQRAGKTRSAYISTIIDNAASEARWERVYGQGRQTARRFGITSEDEINQIVHDFRHS